VTTHPTSARTTLGARARPAPDTNRPPVEKRAHQPLNVHRPPLVAHPRHTPNINVYLAGKIGKNDWRHKLVPGLRSAVDSYSTDLDDLHIATTIAPGLSYVGPYFASCDHGCYHTPSTRHALGGNEPYGYPQCGDRDHTRTEIAATCIEQIGRADVIIAVVNDDAHGTLVEIGYALGTNKRVIVTAAGDRCTTCTNNTAQNPTAEAWFPFHLPGVETRCCTYNAIEHIAAEVETLEAVEQARLEEQRCESPLELAHLRDLREILDELYDWDEVLADDPVDRWHRVDDVWFLGHKVPAWRRDGSTNPYSAKAVDNVLIVWSSTVAERLGINPGSGINRWDMLCLFAGLDPRETARKDLAELQESERCESPLERAFLRAMRKHNDLDTFKPNVQVLGGRYRIDFADTDRRIGIEIDGHQWHSTKQAFARDRVRQREIETAGWRIVRFSGQEVHTNPQTCVDELRDWIKKAL